MNAQVDKLIAICLLPLPYLSTIGQKKSWQYLGSGSSKYLDHAQLLNTSPTPQENMSPATTAKESCLRIDSMLWL